MQFIPLPKKAHDLTGKRFTHLVVLGPVEIRRYVGATHVIWACRCDCGKISNVAAGQLRSGGSRSCGCQKARWCAEANIKHGNNRSRSVGVTPEYRAWSKIKERCHNPSDHAYLRYGARGIVMCEEWRNDFSAFLRDMGPRPSPDHSIDRKRNDLGYFKANCRWATRLEQANNKTDNVWLEAFGRRQTVAQWAREVKIKVGTLQRRMKLGWDTERALTTPARPQNLYDRSGYHKRWCAANPDKYVAQHTLNNAVRRGKLRRGACEVCGAENAHAHHDDYSRPLDVRWLCTKHHREHHARVIRAWRSQPRTHDDPTMTEAA